MNIQSQDKTTYLDDILSGQEIKLGQRGAGSDGRVKKKFKSRIRDRYLRVCLSTTGSEGWLINRGDYQHFKDVERVFSSKKS